MRHDVHRLAAILADATQTTVRVECRDLDSARKLRYALARKRGPAGGIIIRLRGRIVIAEPCVDAILNVRIS
jgi:hypothetical protein